ncbi:MAG: CDP-glycerol--glycerophosphate glycerophosphotransferase [Treponema sp.]|nr:MAG: CDP-glycerol--glycerophosphate glycerophosphotransferase [Treponema sp.]
MRKAYLFMFSFLIVSSSWAYVDPATGSMLFSAVTGIIISGYFFVKQIIMKLKFFSPVKSVKGKAHSIVLHSEGRQYWNVFKPLVDEFVKRGEACSYYSADPEDPGLKYESPLVETRFIGTGNKAWMHMNMLEADVCVTTTPGLDVLQFRRSKKVKHYSHIFHATDNTAGYKLYSLDYFDSVLMNGDHQAGIIRELEEVRGTRKKDLRIIGCTYLDVLSKEKAKLPLRTNDQFTVLVSPSWGRNGLLTLYGMELLKPLIESGLHIILRPHPQSSISEKAMLDKLKTALAGHENLEWDFQKDNILAMNRSDVMISDFSSIMYDYVFLFQKPVVTFNFHMDPRGFELSDIKRENPFYMSKDSGAIIHMNADNLQDVPSLIRGLEADPALEKKIADLSAHAWMHKGGAGKEGVDAILSIRNGLVES